MNRCSISIPRSGGSAIRCPGRVVFEIAVYQFDRAIWTSRVCRDHRSQVLSRIRPTVEVMEGRARLEVQPAV